MKKSELPVEIVVHKAPEGTPMYEVPKTIINDSNISPNAIMLYILLWNVKPMSIKEMAEKLSLSVSTINRAIRELKRNEYIQSFGRGRNCTYWIIEK